MNKRNKSGIFIPAAVSALIFCLSVAVMFSVLKNKFYEAFTPIAGDVITVVIDAGHGGQDPGCVCEGVKESDINYEIVSRLNKLFTEKGFIVVLTRGGADGLYAEGSLEWNKEDDMQARKEIINSCNASLFLSIHQNSYSDTSVKGAQVFYNGKHPDNELLANNMQLSLAAVAPYENRRQPLENNGYFLLKNSPCPALLIECGFLTNETDRALLCDEDYLDEIAEAIAAASLTSARQGGQRSCLPLWPR